MQIHTMEFDGALLRRGFWLYVWRVDHPQRCVVYVGRTGDSSSPNASSPFRRIGQHLDTAKHAKGNSLAKNLRVHNIEPTECRFRMTALGPFFDEQQDFEAHKPFRDRTAALEGALALWFRDRGYFVLGTHRTKLRPDPEQFSRLVRILEPSFPHC